MLRTAKYFLLVSIFLTSSVAEVKQAGAANYSRAVIFETNPSVFDTFIRKTYDTCGLEKKGMSYNVFEKAIVGYYNLQHKKSAVIQKSILTIVDFQKRSKEKRLWVIDLAKSKVLFHTLVAHGKNTGEDMAINFSNTPESNMSSLGFYYTGETYCGKHGLSMRLNGLDEGFNTNARERAIVMHGADYVCEEFIDSYGRLGRSQGCPAVPVKEHKEIIETIAGGSVLFIHHESAAYQSVFLDKKAAEEQFLKGEKLGLK